MRAYIFRSSNLHTAGSGRYATTMPSDAATDLPRSHGIAGVQGVVVGYGEESGGEHERQRIGEFPLSPTYMSVILPYCPIQRRARATVSHFLTWLPELPCIFVALAEHAFWPRGGSGATPHVRSPSLRMSKTPPPDSASSPLPADICPSGCSSCSCIIVGPGLPPDRSC